MNLMEKYFPSRREQEADAAEAEASAEYASGVAEEFIRHEGFGKLEEWLEGQLIASEVSAGDHAAMLASVGFREGLRRVQSHLANIKKTARGENYV